MNFFQEYWLPVVDWISMDVSFHYILGGNLIDNLSHSGHALLLSFIILEWMILLWTILQHFPFILRRKYTWSTISVQGKMRKKGVISLPVSFLPILKSIFFPANRLARCVTFQWSTGQSKVMLLKTTGFWRVITSSLASSGVNGLTCSPANETKRLITS